MAGSIVSEATASDIRDGELLAAIDIGSNSFHLLVARYEHGSLRVIATAAQWLGLVPAPCLPRPVQPLEGEARRQLGTLLDGLALA